MMITIGITTERPDPAFHRMMAAIVDESPEGTIGDDVSDRCMRAVP
jgi:hypothetical protein